MVDGGKYTKRHKLQHYKNYFSFHGTFKDAYWFSNFFAELIRVKEVSSVKHCPVAVTLLSQCTVHQDYVSGD